jgi:hypothetical protein
MADWVAYLTSPTAGKAEGGNVVQLMQGARAKG